LLKSRWVFVGYYCMNVNLFTIDSMLTSSPVAVATHKQQLRGQDSGHFTVPTSDNSHTIAASEGLNISNTPVYNGGGSTGEQTSCKKVKQEGSENGVVKTTTQTKPSQPSNNNNPTSEAIASLPFPLLGTVQLVTQETAASERQPVFSPCDKIGNFQDQPKTPVVPNAANQEIFSQIRNETALIPNPENTQVAQASKSNKQEQSQIVNSGKVMPVDSQVGKKMLTNTEGVRENPAVPLSVKESQPVKGSQWTENGDKPPIAEARPPSLKQATALISDRNSSVVTTKLITQEQPAKLQESISVLKGQDSQSSTLGQASSESLGNRSRRMPDNIPIGEQNVKEIQVSVVREQDHSGFKSDMNAIRGLEHGFVVGHAQTLSQRAVVSDGFTEAGKNMLSTDIPKSVGEQVIGSVQSSLQQGDGRITIQLHPPELGSVVVKFQQEQGGINGLMEVSKAETKFEIEQALPEIVRGLEESGVRISRIEVILTDHSQRDADQGQFLGFRNGGTSQDSMLSEHGFSSGDNFGREGMSGLHASQIDEHWESDLQEQLGQDSINVLV
jgi:flagellar hook-length control protein FliK